MLRNGAEGPAFSAAGLNRRGFLAGLAAATLSTGFGLSHGGSLSAEDPIVSRLEPIGGHWYATRQEPRTYYYKDGNRYVDLFAHHLRDTNKDGIPDVRLSHDETFVIMDTQNYPSHPTAVFPNNSNPNRILPQKFQFKLPLQPKLAESITRLPMGPVGVAINGVVFFNPFEMGGINAIEGYSEVWLDSCCGHPQQEGVYHYHKYPTCVKSPFKDDGKQHSPIIGFAWDGFPLYGPHEGSNEKAKDLKGDRALDVCNGHSDSERGYHYHVTPGRFPYITGGYAGVPELSNSRELSRHQTKGAIRDNSSGKSTLGAAIESVQPGTAISGKVETVRIRLTKEAARRFHVPREAPHWVQFGPYSATNISRKGDVIEVQLSIPSDAAQGVLLDCHIEFEPATAFGWPIVIKKNDVFRVINETPAR